MRTGRPPDRAYGDTRASKATLTKLDQLYAMVRELDPQLELKYNKFYVELARGGQPHNFVVFRPRRNSLMLTVRLPQSAETQSELEESGLELVDFDKREGAYRVRLGPDDLQQRTDVLRQLVDAAYQRQLE